MRYLGLMSGTSADAIDAALVDIEGDELVILDYRQFPIAREVRQALAGLNAASSLSEATELDALTGELFASATRALLAANGLKPEQVKAIGSHGQTVLHLPAATPPRTLQIGNPNLIANLTGIDTVADFRRADMAAGGQGAPLAPAFHAWKFRSDQVNRVVLNLGGMANVTLLPADAAAEVQGFDTGPGNTLMDAWIQRCLNRDFDEDGEWAASGESQDELLTRLLSDPYFSAAPPKSTGKDDFNLGWLTEMMGTTGDERRPHDVQASLLELTAASVTEAIATRAPQTEEVLVCGGGARNLVLMRRLRQRLPGLSLKSTAEFGIDPDAVEAVAFAWLAKQRLDEIPANLPAVTGARQPVILGGLYKSNGK